MDADRLARAKRLFLAARELTHEQQSGYVERGCADDAELRSFVSGLLEADAAHAPSDAGSTAAMVRSAPLPEWIGPYRILGEIGTGGMGTVYLGERREPIRRRVAVKVLKAGMDSGAVLARFEAERQALALMDHPGIAKVWDAGATEAGHPFFAMELVMGEPITAYCSARRLSNRERLELFLPVCHAIQHAHQKGVIHRDLKPSNLLVAELDGKPVVKVIDFGIAKAISAPLAAQTIHTQLGQVLGTPEYMSPEQARLGATDIDTRTDVYSLGVVLYELLTGALPFSSDTLRIAGLEEVLRVIREEDPPKPSTRVSTAAGLSARLARDRHTDAVRFVRELRQDLDWIALRALEKDRVRRYGTPVELAEDIGRFLRNEPVLAGPPSTSYRARKFFRRHRAGVLVAAVLVVSVVGSVAALGFGLHEARRQRRSAEAALTDAAAVRDFLTDLLSAANPDIRQGPDVTVRDLLDEGVLNLANAFAGSASSEAAIRLVIGQAYSRLWLHEKALPQLELAYEAAVEARGPDDALSLDILQWIAFSHAESRDPESAERVLRQAHEGALRAFGPTDTLTVQTTVALGQSLAQVPGRAEEAMRLLLDALNVTGPELRGPVFNGLALASEARGDWSGMVEFAEKALAANEALPGQANRTMNLTDLRVLGSAYARAGRLPEAASTYERLVLGSETIYGPDSPQADHARSRCAGALAMCGRAAEAESLYQRVLAYRAATLGPTDESTIFTGYNVVDCLLMQGRSSDAYESALALLRDSGVREVAPPMTRPAGAVLLALGRARAALGQSRSAESALLGAERAFRESDESRMRGLWRLAVESLVGFYRDRGNAAESARWQSVLPASADDTTTARP